MANSLAERLATGNPEGVDNLLSQNGYAPSRDFQTLIGNINDFISNGSDEEVMAIMQLHPDKEVFEDLDKMREPSRKREQFSNATGHHHNACGCNRNADGFNNCAGCGGKCGGGQMPMHNFVGQGSLNMNDSFAKTAFYTTIFAISIFALVSLSRRPA